MLNKNLIPISLTFGLLFVGAGCIGTVKQRPATVINGPDQVINGIYPSKEKASAAAQLTFTGAVIDADSFKPIPGATVNVLEATSLHATSDVNGRYSLTVPSPAVYTVTVAKDHYKAGTQATFDAIKGPYSVDLTIRPEQRDKRVTIVPDAVYVAGQTGLRVSITDAASGHGVADVGLLTVGGAAASAKSRVTASGGMFVDTQITPGTYMFTMLKFDSAAHLAFKTNFAEAVNDYVITVMPGYTTEVKLSITK